ncbi:MAG: hypothetical protein RIR70_204, partial [Pseudomonadota bacterium]
MSSDEQKAGTNVGSTKPYLIRALYEWCVDQGFTPYLSVAVDSQTQVPKPYVKDGQIVLNLSPEAVHQLSMGNEFITLSARFGGVAHPVSVPVGRVAAIYARENGNGMAFELEESIAPVAEPPKPEAEAEGSTQKSPRPKA